MDSVQSKLKKIREDAQKQRSIDRKQVGKVDKNVVLIKMSKIVF
jgi:hypothetical protein